jgi:precorrin-2 dehydrogenase/sirohydrochlorin ferrochelatase
MLVMRYYPLLLDLTGMHCLVIGTGEVGLRKIKGLLQCAPKLVMAVDPAPPGPEVAGLLATQDNFSYEQRPFAETDLDHAQIVFACTSNRTVNATVGQACMTRGILCNMTDAPELGNFVLPASITRGDLTISISTNGASPALARVIRQDLETRYGPEYEAMTRLLAGIRADLLALGRSSDDNREIFRRLAASPLPELIRHNDRHACLELLRAVLPTDLHPRIGEWCNDCFPNF